MDNFDDEEGTEENQSFDIADPNDLDFDDELLKNAHKIKPTDMDGWTTEPPPKEHRHKFKPEHVAHLKDDL